MKEDLNAQVAKNLVGGEIVVGDVGLGELPHVILCTHVCGNGVGVGGVSTREVLAPPGVLGGSTSSRASTLSVPSLDKKNIARVAYCALFSCALILATNGRNASW